MWVQVWVNIHLKEAHNKNMLLIHLSFFFYLANRLSVLLCTRECMTKKPNKNPAFIMLMLDLITAVVICECLWELLEEKPFIILVGASADQLNQNLWVWAQTLVNFKKIVMLNTNHTTTALWKWVSLGGPDWLYTSSRVKPLNWPFKRFNLDILDNVTEEIPSQCLAFTNYHIAFV